MNWSIDDLRELRKQYESAGIQFVVEDEADTGPRLGRILARSADDERIAISRDFYPDYDQRAELKAILDVMPDLRPSKLQISCSFQGCPDGAVFMLPGALPEEDRPVCVDHVWPTAMEMGRPDQVVMAIGGGPELFHILRRVP